MQKPDTLVVLRFSAMGDVAMVAPVLKELLQQHPRLQLVVVSRAAFAPFFANIPNVRFHALQPKDLHKGLRGLARLAREIKTLAPHAAVADLHDNIRSRTVSLFLRLSGMQVARIDKGRAEKKALTRTKNKRLVQLKHSTERYADVFRKLGYPLTLSHQLRRHPRPLPAGFNLPETGSRLAIAPFAQHDYKVYPAEKMERVIEGLAAADRHVYIFGGGQREKQQAEIWAARFPAVQSLIGKFSLDEELAILSNLDLMLSMDSSGMHMASLCGLPVISIWGPTHPYAGFLGYGQNIEDCIQPEHPARPNSIYGNKPCYCGNVPCMELISPDEIVEKVLQKLAT